MSKKHRGVLSSQELLQKAKFFFGENFDVSYVRLLSYIDYVLKNFGAVRESALTVKEHEIVTDLCVKKFIKVSGGIMTCTSKEFYNVMCEILWDAYVEQN